MPATYHLDIYRGDTGSWLFTFWADDDATVPYDLAGSTATAQLRASPGDPELLAELSAVVTPPNEIQVGLTPELSEPLPAGRWAWDLQVVDGAGAVQTLVAGQATVVADVTTP